MIALTQTDRIFKDSHKVGNFAVWSITVTTSGMVNNDCVSRRQRDKAPRIKVYEDHSCLCCFHLGSEIKKKGVISYILLSVDPKSFRSMKMFVRQED